MTEGAYGCDMGFEINIRETIPKTACTIQTDIIIDY